MFDNPVVGPPPPRIEAPAVALALRSPADSDASDETAQFELTEFRNAGSDGDGETHLTGRPGEVAARVNGTPILVSEVLQPYAPQLEMLRKAVSEEEFRQKQRELVQRDLPHYIDTAVVVDAVLNQMDADQKSAVDEQLDQIFQEELENLMRTAGVQSVQELEAVLKSRGKSLGEMFRVTGETVPEIRKAFGRHALSTQYLRESIGTIAEPTRLEMLEEYRKRKDDYSQPARVKWQQLQINFAEHNGRDNARTALSRARQDLQSGVSFDEVVRAHGDGPLAKLGGHFDWTQPESVADPKLREALQSLTVGEISGPIEGDKAYMLVRLTEAQSARTTPFEDVQDELRKAVTERKQLERITKVVQDIKSKAVIENMFEVEPSVGDRQVSPVSVSISPTS